jgi:hypothetical protein
MDKLLLFPGKNERGIFTYVIDHEHDHLTKTASEYHPEIAAYIAGAKKIPGFTQLLLTALGAGEYWGCNVNGDYFPEKALAYPGPEYGFKTFENNAHVFKHHINKDPAASYGDVALAVYNPKYRRVELIVRIDNKKAPDIVEKIDAGEYPDWSMGCRVPYDVCSVCGNRARNRTEYCSHLKYYMGKVEPESGKQAYAINLTPKFFDISMVLIGADRIAKSLKKVASAPGRPTISSAFLADKMAGDKNAEMEKQVPAQSEGEVTPPASMDQVKTIVKAIPEVKATEKSLPREVLNDLGRRDLSKVMSTLAMLGVLPKPQEFQRIILVNIGKENIADQLDAKNIAFDPMMCPTPKPAHLKLMRVSHRNFDPSIMGMMNPFMGERSYAAPHLGKRLVVMLKQGSDNTEKIPNYVKFASKEENDQSGFGIIPTMMLAAGLYSAFGEKASREAPAFIDDAIRTHPGLLAALGIGGTMIFNSMFGEKTKGQYDPQMGMHPPIDPDVNNMLARSEAMKEKPLLKIGKAALGPAGKRLFLGIPAVYMASGVLQKRKNANPYAEEAATESLIRRRPDLVGMGLAIDAMAGKKGTQRIFSKLAPFAQNIGQKAQKAVKDFGLAQAGLPKMGSAEEYLSNAVTWPLAISKRTLPGRILGGAFDAAVFDASGKILSNAEKKSKMQTNDDRRN